MLPQTYITIHKTQAEGMGVSFTLFDNGVWILTNSNKKLSHGVVKPSKFSEFLNQFLQAESQTQDSNCLSSKTGYWFFKLIVANNLVKFSTGPIYSKVVTPYVKLDSILNSFGNFTEFFFAQ